VTSQQAGLFGFGSQLRLSCC